MRPFAPTTRAVVALAGALTLAGPTASLRASTPSREVNVNTTLTEAGRKLTLPTKDKPVYYYPLVGGYREEGAIVAGEKKPDTKATLHVMAKALAAQHFLVVSKDHPQPDVLLVFFWGYMNPQTDDVGPSDQPQTVFWNEREMLALVGGQSLTPLDLGFERDTILEDARDDRYFAIVTAYDFADAKLKKKTLLWSARMSTPSNGITLAEVIPALLTSGAPMFGHASERPQWINAPLTPPEGKVEVGTPVVVPDKANPGTTQPKK